MCISKKEINKNTKNISTKNYINNINSLPPPSPAMHAHIHTSLLCWTTDFSLTPAPRLPHQRHRLAHHPHPPAPPHMDHRRPPQSTPLTPPLDHIQSVHEGSNSVAPTVSVSPPPLRLHGGARTPVTCPVAMSFIRRNYTPEKCAPAAESLTKNSSPAAGQSFSSVVAENIHQSTS